MCVGARGCVQCAQDLGTVKKNLARGIYNGKAHEMLEDIELVFQNCQTYTGYDKTSEYARTADTILTATSRHAHCAGAGTATGLLTEARRWFLFGWCWSQVLSQGGPHARVRA